MSAAEIGGRYRLEGRLGYGGMSTVHLALDLRLERQVAVKLLAEHLAEDPTFISRFQREAQAAARLVHPNIVQVFDSGQDEASGQYYIVMEYIEGQSCAEILRDDGWLEVDEAIAIIDQACEGHSLTELALKQQQEAPPMLDTLVAAVSPQLAEAVAISLALDPRERYQTARAMGRALSDGANGIAPGERAQAGRQAPTEATSVLSAGSRSGGRGADRTVTALAV